MPIKFYYKCLLHDLYRLKHEKIRFSKTISLIIRSLSCCCFFFVNASTLFDSRRFKQRVFNNLPSSNSKRKKHVISLMKLKSNEFLGHHNNKYFHPTTLLCNLKRKPQSIDTAYTNKHLGFVSEPVCVYR